MLHLVLLTPLRQGIQALHHGVARAARQLLGNGKFWGEPGWLIFD